MTYTIEQILKAGDIAEISPIDAAWLALVLIREFGGDEDATNVREDISGSLLTSSTEESTRTR